MKERFVKNSILLPFLAALALAATYGWLSIDGHDISGTEESDRWDQRLAALTQLGADETDGSRYSRLASSTFMPVSEEALAARLENADAVEVGEAPPFPKIVGAAIVNGRPQVHILLDGTISAVQSGERLESGWEIVSVDMQSVVAQYEGDETRFAVLDY